MLPVTIHRTALLAWTDHIWLTGEQTDSEAQAVLHSVDAWSGEPVGAYPFVWVSKRDVVREWPSR
jgi:hypothetical protein